MDRGASFVATAAVCPVLFASSCLGSAFGAAIMLYFDLDLFDVLYSLN